jgi:hypothetical protein
LTTIGVFLIWAAKSSARASAASEVCSPRMISSSGSLCTGEKKCRPMKSSRRCTPSARVVIGSVEVFEPSNASGATTGSTSANTWCLSRTFSKTASMTRSQPARSVTDSVGVIRASTSSRLASVTLPRETALSSSVRE